MDRSARRAIFTKSVEVPCNVVCSSFLNDCRTFCHELPSEIGIFGGSEFESRLDDLLSIADWPYWLCPHSIISIAGRSNVNSLSLLYKKGPIIFALKLHGFSRGAG